MNMERSAWPELGHAGQRELERLLGRPITPGGCVEVDGDDDGPTKLVFGSYTDARGLTHVVVGEWYPPDYALGKIVADVTPARTSTDLKLI